MLIDSANYSVWHGTMGGEVGRWVGALPFPFVLDAAGPNR